jgi:tetratricopeptide (TPR) repeat protein
MGSVYRALDQHTGEPVAVKVLSSEAGIRTERFVQEALLLGGLSHPAIVRYVEHGCSADGRLFLVMEWLEGEDLGRRLARGALSVSDAVTVVERAAGGLAAAHARGVVHRDVKPGNLFLEQGDPARARLLDFGVAHAAGRRVVLTHEGTVVGTAGYMAPEQAGGDVEIDARADVFSLGCVLFACLCGSSPFRGNHLVAVLGRILLEDAPRLRERRPDVPVALDALAARMLCRARETRPRDAAEIEAELRRIRLETPMPRQGLLAPERTGVASPRAASQDTDAVHPGARVETVTSSMDGMTWGERRHVSLLVVRADAAGATSATDEWADELRVSVVARRFELDVRAVADGSELVTASPRRALGPDGSAQLAVCALALRDAFPTVRLALVTGLMDSADRVSYASALERAAELLEGGPTAAKPSPVRLDDTSARLLASRFEVSAEPRGPVLVGRREWAGAARTLLGKAVPLMGRDKELALLEATLRECREEPTSRFLIVSGGAGCGKSRLGRELVHRARALGPISVWFAQADCVGVGSPLGLVRQLVRSAASLQEPGAVDLHRARLRACIGACLAEPDASRCVELLGDLVGVPADKPSPELRAARNDPGILSEQTRAAFARWVDAATQAGPVLVLLEDLQWGDDPSSAWLLEAVRRLRDRPMMVLGIGRLETEQRLPRLWAAPEVQHLGLVGLTRRASERLARAVLGREASDETVGRVVAQADGNAFFLEELLRGAADGDSRLPETVLAVAHARLGALEPDARRILRAASVFGQAFCAEGIVALLGGQMDARDVGGWLAALAARELLEVRASARAPADVEYSFRNAILREAAYCMLTDEDRGAAHRLAAGWLAGSPAADCSVVAEHFERAGEQALAAPWLARAADTALAAGSFEQALALASRALEIGVQADQQGRLHVLQAGAYAWRGDWPRSLHASGCALHLVRPGSPWFFLCVATRLLAAHTVGDEAAVGDAVLAMLRDDHPVEASGPFALATCVLSTGLLHVGQRDLALGIIQRLEDVACAQADPDPAFQGWLHASRVLPALFVHEDLGLAVRSAREATALLGGVRDIPGLTLATTLLGLSLDESGDTQEALRLLRDAEAQSERIGGAITRHLATALLVRALSRAGDVAGATLRARIFLESADAMTLQIARGLAAVLQLEAGELDEAQTHARATIAHEGVCLILHRLAAFHVLARVALARNRPIDALEMVEHALRLRDLGVGGPLLHAELLRTKLEALLGVGRVPDARELASGARPWLLRVAATIEPPQARERFLRGPETGGLLALAGACEKLEAMPDAHRK